MSIFDLKYLAGGLEKEERKRALSDEELQGKISGLIDKRKYLVETKIPALKGTPDYEPAMKELQGVETGLREMYHPDVNPGAIAKFGHLLTDHLGIKVKNSNAEGLGTKKDPLPKESLSDYRKRKAYDKNQAELAGDIKKAEQDIAAGPLSPEQQAGVDARKKLADFMGELQTMNGAWDKSNEGASQEEKDAAHIENRQRLFQKTFPPPKDIEEIWKDTRGAVAQPDPDNPGQYRIDQTNKYGKHQWRTMEEGYTPPVPVVKNLPNAAQLRADYMKEKGIPPGTPLTLKDDEEIRRRMALAGNPYGQAHIDIARQGLGLREREANVKDTMSLVKQLSPLDRIIHTSEEADSDVSNPTGPGDVALTLAFFDAIKTTGVRFTQTEQNFITKSRGIIENAKSAYEKGFEGTIYGPPGSEQRRILADIIKKSADVSKKQKGNLVSGVGQFNPQAVAAATGGATSQGGGDMITMKLADGRTGPIHKSQKSKFIADNPGAVEVTGGR